MKVTFCMVLVHRYTIFMHKNFSQKEAEQKIVLLFCFCTLCLYENTLTAKIIFGKLRYIIVIDVQCSKTNTKDLLARRDTQRSKHSIHSIDNIKVVVYYEGNITHSPNTLHMVVHST